MFDFGLFLLCLIINVLIAHFLTIEKEKKDKIEKSIREKESFRQSLLNDKKIKLEYTEAIQLPPGQREVKSWIVLDLGIRPTMNLNNYKLELEGLLGNNEFISFNQLKDIGVETFKSDFHCYTSWSFLDMTWEGVSMKKILAKYPPRKDWKYMIQYGADGYTCSCPRDVIESAPAFITWKANGTDLSSEHGVIRMIIPDHYGSKGSKYLEKIEFTTENKKGFWEQRGYHDRANVWRQERLDDSSINVGKTLDQVLSEYDNGEFFDVSGMKLKQLDLKIFKFEKIACLSLNNNLLDVLPDEIGDLQRLIRLNINQNKLTSIPKSIANLKFLSELYLFENELTELPDEIVNLQFLSVLGLDRNKLVKLPERIGEMKNLSAIFCDYNLLEELPVSISEIDNMTALMFTGNPIKKIPLEFSKLKGLRYLGISSGLPEEILAKKPAEILEYLENEYQKTKN